jgi:histidine triad (HIT) family protein
MATIFQQIMQGEIKADIVYEDKDVVAFKDINPKAPVHILIVPRKVIPTANDIVEEDEAVVGHMMKVAADIAKEHGIADNGYRLIMNCNDHGGQEVYHLHLHLLGGAPMGPMVMT